TPEDFGELHGKLFRDFVDSPAYKAHFSKPPVICISASSSKVYHRTENRHPILGVEYQQNERSSTDQYFEKMGMEVRFFMPAGSSAPLAFYFQGDLLGHYSNLELISTISTMDTFQKIYRPEIYNANSVAANIYQPSLKNQDYSLTQIVYDREERSQLAVKQGKFAEERFIKPYKAMLESWAANHAF
ncbi:MAG: putative oxygenase MesX, partial [Burkholderiaceae bacterium]